MRSKFPDWEHDGPPRGFGIDGKPLPSLSKTKEEVIEGLKSGRRLRCDRRDDPLLPWLLDNPDIENSGVIQVDDQYSYIEFWWKPQTT